MRFMRWSISILCLMALSVACTREAKNENATLKLKLPQEVLQKSSGAGRFQSASSPGWSYSDPSDISDIKCYGVAVETPEASSPRQCFDAHNNLVMTPNILAGPFRVGSQLELMVPAGPSRKIHLIGSPFTIALQS